MSQKRRTQRAAAGWANVCSQRYSLYSAGRHRSDLQGQFERLLAAAAADDDDDDAAKRLMTNERQAGSVCNCLH